MSPKTIRKEAEKINVSHFCRFSMKCFTHLKKIIIDRFTSTQIFYWSHLLYIPFWILTIFHGPNFWKWFIVPGVIYLIERVRRLVWLRSQRGKTYISSGLLLPSKVTHLVIKRPHHFDFRPGDYVFVNIPVIAKYEWHPFTISSAPEQEGNNKFIAIVNRLYLESSLKLYNFRLHVASHSCRGWMDQQSLHLFR